MNMRSIAFASFLVLAALPVMAADVGDPIFPADLGDKARAELIYQNFQRDLDSGAEFQADAYLVRLHTDVGQYAYLDFDLGAIEPDGSDLGFYGGVGLRYLAYDSDQWRISPWFQVHYAPSLDDEGAEYSMLDGDAGILLAAKLHIDKDLTVMPYAGPALSIIRINGDDPLFGETTETDMEEDQVIGAVAGISLQMPGQNSFRVEAQFFDQVSISAAAGIAF